MFARAIFPWRLRVVFLVTAVSIIVVAATAWYSLYIAGVPENSAARATEAAWNEVRLTRTQFLSLSALLVILSAVLGVQLTRELGRDLAQMHERFSLLSLSQLLSTSLRIRTDPRGPGVTAVDGRASRGRLPSEVGAIEPTLNRLGQQLRELQEVSFELSRLDMPQTVMSRATSALRRVLKAPRAFIALVDQEDPSVLLVQAAEGYDLQGVRVPISGTVLGQVLRNGIPRVVTDLTMQPDDLIPRQKVRAGQVMSGVYACLDGTSGPIGVCGVHDRPPERFGGQDAAVLASLASHISLALENARVHARLQAAAMTDALTGLYNRRFLEVGAVPLLSRGPAALLLVDLDHFKQINDTMGHEAGDQVLRQISRLLVGHTRSRDRLVRFGGDEFLVLLPGSTGREAQQIGERIRHAVASAPLHVAGQEIRLTVSIGVADWQPRETGADQEQLLHRADTALYAAKAGGRNRVVLADPAADLAGLLQ